MHDDVAKQPVDQTLVVSRNYQAVYADLLDRTRTCLRAGTAITPMAYTTVDGQLYPELGYGEVIAGLSGMMPGLTSVTRVERAANGAVVKIKTANLGEVAARRDRGWIAYWARSGKACAALGRMDPPTA